MRRRNLALGIALLAIGLMPWPAQAQTPTPVEVRIVPPVVKVAAGEKVDVAVEVVQVQELYGFDVAVAFDPQVLEVVDADTDQAGVQVAQGLFLDPGFTVINSADNAAGGLHFVMTQLNPSEPKSGTGALIVVTFVGKAPGQSSVLSVVNPQLSRRDGFLMPTVATAGQIEVVSRAGPTHTPMPAQGAGTPMAEITPEPTVPQPTALPATATAVPSSPTAAPTATTVPSPPPVTPTRPAADPTPTPSVVTAAPATPQPTDTPLALALTDQGDDSPGTPGAGAAWSNPWLPVALVMLAIAAGVVLLPLWLRRRGGPR